MKRLLFLLLFIPAFALGQSVYTYGGNALTYGGDVLIEVPSTYCAEYQAVYDAYTTKPSAEAAAIDNTMVAGLVSDGVWAKLDVFYLYAVHTNDDGEALINIINPGTYDATAYNAPTFTALEGFTGADTKYIDWNVSLNALTNYAQNDGCIGAYVRTNVDESATVIGAETGADRTTLFIRSSDNATLRLNASSGTGTSNTDSRGMYIGNRVLSTHHDLYKNGALLIHDNIASSGIPTHNMYSLCRNNDGVAELFVTTQLSMIFAGGGLTQTDITNLTNRFETRMDALGKGVIAQIDPLEQLNDLLLIQYLAFQQRIKDYENAFYTNP